MLGNVFGQSSSTENPTVVAYGAEGGRWPQNRLRIAHNTFYSEGWMPAWFLRVFTNRLSSTPTVITRNNLLAGFGLFTAGVDGDHQGNHFVRRSALGDPSIMDFTLGRDSSLRGIVSDADLIAAGLQPQFQHLIPGQVSAITDSSKRVPGAMQSSQRIIP